MTVKFYRMSLTLSRVIYEQFMIPRRKVQEETLSIFFDSNKLLTKLVRGTVIIMPNVPEKISITITENHSELSSCVKE